MSDGPYSKSSTAGSSWPQGKPTDPDEWTEDELNAWIDEQARTNGLFRMAWINAPFCLYLDGAAW